MADLEIMPKKGQHILDAGCGPAGIFTILDEFKTDAIDPLLEQYEKDLPHFSESDYPNTRFFNQSLESFSADQQYDLIFCLNAINHVADLDKSLDTLFKHLHPDGQLIISTDVHKHQWLKPIFKAIPGDILHPHQYDLKEYREMFLKRGAKIEKEVKLKGGNIFEYWVWILSPGPAS